MKCVLNVGGGSKAIRIPDHYAGWEHLLLDIDPALEPDVLCDGRDLMQLPAADFDAIFCSHNLEHYWRHDLPAVLAGFVHVLREDGFAEIAVPDIAAVFVDMQQRGLDLDDVLYESPMGPITPNDVIYGFGAQIAASGEDFYAHKNAFSTKSLTRALTTAGFRLVYAAPGPWEIRAFAFKRDPSPELRTLLKLGPAPTGA